MGTLIIFILVTILCAYATLKSIAKKQILSIVFAGLSFLVFGWFSVMTIISLATTGGGIPG